MHLNRTHLTWTFFPSTSFYCTVVDLTSASGNYILWSNIRPSLGSMVPKADFCLPSYPSPLCRDTSRLWVILLTRRWRSPSSSCTIVCKYCISHVKGHALSLYLPMGTAWCEGPIPAESLHWKPSGYHSGKYLNFSGESCHQVSDWTYQTALINYYE